MTRANVSSSPHPSLEALALYSSSDLPFLTRWEVRRHVNRCALCEQQVLQFRSAKAELKREAASETLTGFEAIADWSRLEREMLGNIAVGLAAARCIDNVGRKRAFFSRSALVSALIALFVIGWMTHIPQDERNHLAQVFERWLGFSHPAIAGTVLQSTPDGIAVRAQGATLTILHPRSAVVSLSGTSAVAARYVDEETGQVTITNVYGQ